MVDPQDMRAWEEGQGSEKSGSVLTENQANERMEICGGYHHKIRQREVVTLVVHSREMILLVVVQREEQDRGGYTPVQDEGVIQSTGRQVGGTHLSLWAVG